MVIVQGNSTACRWCGFIHGPACPSVKSLEFFADGVTVKRVEYRDPGPAVTGPYVTTTVYPVTTRVGGTTDWCLSH